MTASFSHQRAIIVVAKLLHARSEAGYGDEGMPPSLASFAEQAGQMLGIDDSWIVSLAAQKLQAGYIVGLINSGRYGQTKSDKIRAMKSTAKELGITVETLEDYAKQAQEN